MSYQKQTIINPKTNRPIVVGGRVWTLLLREGLIKNNYKDSNILYEIEQPEQEQEYNEDIEADEELKNLEPLPLVRYAKNLENSDASESIPIPEHQHAVRGRGKYKGKMVLRNKQLKPAQVHKQVAECAVRAVKNYKNHSDHFTDDDNDEQLDNLIQQMIMDEMVNNNSDEEFEISSGNE